jgi:hypothetical protein
MTREELTAALVILDPPAERRDECVHDIVRQFESIEQAISAARGSRVLGGKGKGGLERYLRDLRRARASHRALDPSLAPFFSPQANNHEIAIAEALVAAPSPPLAQDRTHRYRAAAEAAYKLLLWWDHKAVVTRGGEWEQLAAIMAGDPGRDMFDHLRACKSDLPTVVRKLRDPNNGSVSIAFRRKPGIK